MAFVSWLRYGLHKSIRGRPPIREKGGRKTNESVSWWPDIPCQPEIDSEAEQVEGHFFENLNFRMIDLFSFFKWANPGLFFLYFQSFQTNNTIFTTNQCEKMYILYTAPGFEPTAFRKWVVTHNHYTTALPPKKIY